jgi:hypothetical protein
MKRTAPLTFPQGNLVSSGSLCGRCEELDPFLEWIENSGLSVAMRESDYAFPLTITVHVASVALVAGTSLPISLRLAGGLKGVALEDLLRYLPIFWVGLVISIVTGLLLLIAYPTKSLTNPLFYLKLAAIVVAVAAMWSVRRSAGRAVPFPGTALAARASGFASLGLWTFTIAAGRLLAYTYSRLMVGF